jgi:hypothetical protein
MTALIGQILTGAAVVTSLVASAPARAQEIEVFKSQSCSCCGLWIDHLKRHGLTPAPKNATVGELARIKAAAGLKPELQSCHTGKIAGYVIEGHVPAADIKRLLADKPDAIGLTVHADRLPRHGSGRPPRALRGAARQTRRHDRSLRPVLRVRSFRRSPTWRNEPRSSVGKQEVPTCDQGRPSSGPPSSSTKYAFVEHEPG